ncbi:MAG: hypothetical protein MI975_03155 [Cytophagales bacterium]|nr:hypothetical protein [Cytophagales bacterium]
MKTFYLLSLIILFYFSGCVQNRDATADNMGKLEQMLNDHTLNLWYPRVIDKNNGGYH